MPNRVHEPVAEQEFRPMKQVTLHDFDDRECIGERLALVREPLREGRIVTRAEPLRFVTTGGECD
jgi:hypothetical protein